MTSTGSPVAGTGAAPSLRAARGLLLGLLLGDAVGGVAGRVPERGPLEAGAGGQLACWTVEGLIRAHVRSAHRGGAPAPAVVFAAYARWAARRGDLDPVPVPLDGWLAQVPALAERRGTSTGTVQALRGGPAATDGGAHAVVRTLPVGLFSWSDALSFTWAPDPGTLARQIAAPSDGGDVPAAAAAGAALVAGLVRGLPIDVAVRAAPAGNDLSRAVALARNGAGDPRIVRGLAREGTAASALTGGVYAATTATGPHDLPAALLLAAAAGDGGHAATVAGALLGVLHGPEALPVDWLARAELAWPGDVLAQDLVRQLTGTPSGTTLRPATDPLWWDRYPGS